MRFPNFARRARAALRCRPMRWRGLGSVVVAALCLTRDCAGLERRHPVHDDSAPERRRHRLRRRTTRRESPHAQCPAAAGARGRALRPLLHDDVPASPLARKHPSRAIRTTRDRRELSGLTGTRLRRPLDARHVAPRRRVHDRDGGQVPERLHPRRRAPHPAGWDRWVAMDSIPEERYYRYTLNVNGRRVDYGRQPADYSTSVLTRKALGFIRSADHPFFLYFAPIAPHLPAIPAPRDRGSIGESPPLRSPAFDEADISDKPWRAVRWGRSRLVVCPTTSRRSGAASSRRCAARPIGRADRRRAASEEAPRPDGDPLRQRQRVRCVGRASTRGQHLAVRGVDRPSPRDPDAVATRGRESRSPLALNVDLAPTVAAAGGRPPSGHPAGRPEPRVFWACRTLHGGSTGSSSTAGRASFGSAGRRRTARCARIGFSTSPTTTAGGSCTTCDATRGSSTTSRARDATLSRSATSPGGSPLSRRRRHAARDQGWSTVVTSRPCPIGTVTDTSVGSACRAAA